VSELSIEDLNKKLVELAGQAEAILKQYEALRDELNPPLSKDRNDSVIKHMLHPSEKYTSICGWLIGKQCEKATLVPYGSHETNCKFCQDRYYLDQLGSRLVWLYEKDAEVTA
jgi:hypothetical protein